MRQILITDSGDNSTLQVNTNGITTITDIIGIIIRAERMLWKVLENPNSSSTKEINDTENPKTGNETFGWSIPGNNTNN